MLNKLLPSIDGEPHLTLTAGYSEQSGAVELTFQWPSPTAAADPMQGQGEDDLSLLLLQKLLKSHSMAWDGANNLLRTEL